MIITTARKPSSKIRIFCKHLSRFTGWEYVTRGKTSLSAFACEPFLLVGESRGNPGSLTFFSNGECVLYIRVNVSLENRCAALLRRHVCPQAYVNLSERFIKRGVCEAYPNTAQTEVSVFDKGIDFSVAPVIEGNTTLALALGKATGLKMGDSGERIIRANERIEFIDRGIPCIILKVLEIRGEGIV
ncbi:MAG: hypothetical protein WAW23_00080 [Candidatus Methanoperedens sp.]